MENTDTAQLRQEFTGSRKEEVETILTSQFDGIATLGGGYILKEGPDGRKRYYFSSYNPDTARAPYLLTAVKARAIAGKELIDLNPNATVIALSRNKPEGQLSDAEALLEYEERNNPELRTRVQEKDGVIDDPTSNSTITEIMELIELAVKEDMRRIVVTTNDWHLQRVIKMYEMFINDPEKMIGMLRASVKRDPDINEDIVDQVLQDFVDKLAKFKEEERELVFVSSEAALEVRRPGLYTHIIEQAQAGEVYMRINEKQLSEMERQGFKHTVVDFTPDGEGKFLIKTDPYLNRIQMEEKGIKELEEGTYSAGNPEDPNNLFLQYCRRKRAID